MAQSYEVAQCYARRGYACQLDCDIEDCLRFLASTEHPLFFHKFDCCSQCKAQLTMASTAVLAVFKGAESASNAITQFVTNISGLQRNSLLASMMQQICCIGPNKPTECGAGIIQGGLAQLPLTLLNSVVAVCQLSADRFPDNAASPRRVSISVGVMNLIGPWLGALPCCHGAGGLAAQVRVPSSMAASGEASSSQSMSVARPSSDVGPALVLWSCTSAQWLRLSQILQASLVQHGKNCNLCYSTDESRPSKA